MNEDILWIGGTTPADEQCAQVGDPDYARNAKAEGRLFIEAIRNVCGREPEGARLVIKAQGHDYGNYYEVAVAYDPENREAVEYAYKVEEHAPLTWSEAGIEPPATGRGL